MTHLKRQSFPFNNITYAHQKVRLCQTKAILMSQDLGPGAEAQGIPNTVIKQISECRGEIPLLVYEHRSPVLKEQRKRPRGPIPNCSDPSAAASGCHDSGHA